MVVLMEMWNSASESMHTPEIQMEISTPKLYCVINTVSGP